MLKNRVIPALLLRNGGLVKTIKFKDPKYVGDPINAILFFMLLKYLSFPLIFKIVLGIFDSNNICG